MLPTLFCSRNGCLPNYCLINHRICLLYSHHSPPPPSQHLLPSRLQLWCDLISFLTSQWCHDCCDTPLSPASTPLHAATLSHNHLVSPMLSPQLSHTSPRLWHTSPRLPPSNFSISQLFADNWTDSGQTRIRCFHDHVIFCFCPMLTNSAVRHLGFFFAKQISLRLFDEASPKLYPFVLRRLLGIRRADSFSFQTPALHNVNNLVSIWKTFSWHASFEINGVLVIQWKRFYVGGACCERGLVGTRCLCFVVKSCFMDKFSNKLIGFKMVARRIEINPRRIVALVAGYRNIYRV